MKWLITGSSGYIGQHVTHQLIADGFRVVGLDILMPRAASRKTGEFKSYLGDICDTELVSQILHSESVAGIINLAALKSVEESIENPDRYEKVNFFGVQNLLSQAVSVGVKYFIQSSTAAVYGSSNNGFVDEQSPTRPISPYGQTKLNAEHLLNQEIGRGTISGTSLRYFNVIGSSSPELKDTSTANIVPKVLSTISKGEGPLIFGDDYPTPDGTCVRDYVHVEDLARAHVLAARAIQVNTLPIAINIGTGKGYSVREVMREILLQKKSSLEPQNSPRRVGDPDMLVARVDLAKKVLGFQSEKGISEMIASAI